MPMPVPIVHVRARVRVRVRVRVRMRMRVHAHVVHCMSPPTQRDTADLRPAQTLQFVCTSFPTPQFPPHLHA